MNISINGEERVSLRFILTEFINTHQDCEEDTYRRDLKTAKNVLYKIGIRGI